MKVSVTIRVDDGIAFEEATHGVTCQSDERTPAIGYAVTQAVHRIALRGNDAAVLAHAVRFLGVVPRILTPHDPNNIRAIQSAEAQLTDCARIVTDLWTQRDREIPNGQSAPQVSEHEDINVTPADIEAAIDAGAPSGPGADAGPE